MYMSKFDLEWLIRVLPVVLVLCSIAVICLKYYFDERYDKRYIKRNTDSDFRFITKKELEDYKNLVAECINGIREIISDIKHRIDNISSKGD